MSLIRFLKATRSLEGSNDGPNPYRLPEQNLLPKFGSPARGRTRAQEESTKVTASAESAKEVNLSATAQTKTRVMEGKRTWMFWRNWFAPKPLKVAPAAPVQEEFALDGVKVVRNDLTDADVEVRPAERKPKVKVGSACECVEP